MDKTEKLEKFIKDNNLDFTGEGSDLNGNCVILAGYACYLEFDTVEEFIHSLYDTATVIFSEGWEEIERVYNYAKENAYGAWWKTSDAEDQYIFEK